VSEVLSGRNWPEVEARTDIPVLLAALAAAQARVAKLEVFAAKVDGIRDNIIGSQGVNWSRDI